MLKTAAVSWVCFALLALAPAVRPQELETGEAVAKPSSDLLLPYFEVELAQGGATTFFAVVNALGKSTNATVTLHTNWGIPVLTVPLKLSPGQVYTFDLADWLVRGDLPGGKDLSAGELVRLQAVLTGQRSPFDSLYYGTEIDSGRAAGFLALRTTGGGGGGGGGKGNKSRPDALRGETFLVDPEQGPARGHDLLDIDRATSSRVCLRHSLRHLSGTASGTEIATAQVVLWRDVAGQVLPAPVPADRRRKVDVSVFSKAGKLLRKHQLRLLPLEQVTLADLGLTEAQGRVELVTEDPSAIAALASEGGPVFEATCPQTGGPTKNPSVKIVTFANGQDANTPPGPRVAVGSAVNLQYQVTNNGAFPLTQIKVKDDKAGFAKCPKTSLPPGGVMTCTAKGIAEICQQKSMATVTAAVKKRGNVSAQDPAHYFGDDGARVEIVVSTNGQDANDPEGPRVQAGSRVDWTYQVTNTGTIRLYEIKVQDDRGAAVDCPRVSLAPGEPMTCLASGLAVPGSFRNVGTVSASATCGKVSDDDVSHYFGESDTGLRLRARTNGYDADFPPGPTISVGSPVTWEYLVDNSGKLDIHGLSIADSRGIAVSCPGTGLKSGQSMTCIARGVADACEQSLQATVTGQTSGGQSVSDTDASHWVGQAQAAVRIEAMVNGSDADLPPGPSVVIGTLLQWTYEVTNIGKVGLTGVQVADDRGSAVACPRNELRPGESMSCAASGAALSGDFRNLATVTASTPCGDAVSDDDPGHYRGMGDPGIRIRKSTNGQDANVPPGPSVAIGSPVVWEYVVTNTGQLGLSNVAVTDSQGVGVSCPATTLAAGASMTCVGEGVAQACQYSNLGTATGLTPTGAKVSAVDPSYYFGQPDAGVEIETRANGVEADTAPGPTIKVGSEVKWTYTVVNTGDVDLTALQVTDDQGAAVICPQTTLASGETLVCTALGTAAEGQHANTGTVSALPPCGSRISAEDPSHYFGGGDGALLLRKLTNGEDANEAPGPTIAQGDPVAWTYVVTNSGTVSLSGVGVTDDRGVSVICPKSTLQAAESMTCTGIGTAEACQYVNLGLATGTTADGQTVNAVDLSHYFGGIEAGVAIDTFVNGQDADTPPGPTVAVGSAVAWTYTVTNTGAVPLTGVRVSDQPGAAVTCPKTALQPGEQMTCTASGIAAEGSFRNVGAVTAAPPCGAPVSAEDPAHYTGGGAAGLQLRKRVNGQEAEQAPGPSIAVGSQILWTYDVTNSGQVTVSQIQVADDDPVIVVSCPKSALQPGESMTCTGKSTALACQYSNVAQATGLASNGRPAAAADTSYYLGTPQPGIRIETETNGFQADAAPGPTIPVGSPVTWTYTVINTGNVALAGVAVSDSQGPRVTCPGTTLQPGEAMVCTASGTVAEGQYANTGSVEATPACGSPVTATDPSHHFGGGQAGLQIEKRVNDQDVAAPPGPGIPVGQTVRWSYRVTNTGTVALSGVAVADSRGVLVTCPKTALQPGESMDCAGAGTAQACQYDNLGTATGLSAGGQRATAVDPSYYFGQINPGVAIETRINAQDADTAPGPTIQTGSAVTWAYTVINTGNASLANVLVGDDRAGLVTCPKTGLQPGEQMTCYTFGTAASGPFSTTGRVTADPPCGAQVSAADATHYFGGGITGLQLQKKVNGQDSPWPGIQIQAGQPVVWTYVVTNNGQLPLTGVGVDDDDPGVNVSCPKTALQPGEAITCTSNTRTARECQYVNIGTATAQSTGGPISAYGSSFYTGQFQTGIQIETAVNGKDADAAPGASLRTGSPVQWTYRVTNTSTVRLTNVQVRDDQGASVSCPQTDLQPGAGMTCTAGGLAGPGAFRNVGTVTAVPPCGGQISAQDESHYYGVNIAFDLETFVTGQDADTAPGTVLAPGSAIAWTYVVRNQSNVPVSGISVSDDKGISVSCPKNVLAAGETMTCTASGTAQACQYDTAGRAAGTADGGIAVSDFDETHYYGQTGAKIDIEMSVDSDDADVSPGRALRKGAAVTWRYVVTNTGTVPLTNLAVTDDNGSFPDVTVNCPLITTLQPGATMTCTATGTTVAGLYKNTAAVTARDTCGPIPGDQDDTYYNVPVLELRATNSFNSVVVWNNQNGRTAWGQTALWRPVPAPGYSLLGDYFQGNFNAPNGSVSTVRVAQYDDPAQPALRQPIGFARVWEDRGSGATLDGAVWRPIPPAGYVCSGHVSQRGYNAPSLTDPNYSPYLDRYACLRSDLATPASLGNVIRNVDADNDVTLYRVNPLNVIYAIGGLAPNQPAEQTYVPIIP